MLTIIEFYNYWSAFPSNDHFYEIIIYQVLLFGVLVIIIALFIIDLFVRIIHIRINWSWNLSRSVLESCVCGISKPDIRISPPAGLWKVMAKAMIGCSEFFASIDCFAWSKISFKFFVPAFFF